MTTQQQDVIAAWRKAVTDRERQTKEVRARLDQYVTALQKQKTRTTELETQVATLTKELEKLKSEQPPGDVPEVALPPDPSPPPKDEATG